VFLEHAAMMLVMDEQSWSKSDESAVLQAMKGVRMR